MPVVFAFFASAVIHMSVLLGDGWILPNTAEPEELDVVLLPPVTAPVGTAAPAAMLTPPPKPAIRPVNKAASATSATRAPAVPVADSHPDTVAIADASASPQDLGREVPFAPTDTVQGHDVAVAPAAVPVQAALAALSRLPAKGQWRYSVTRGEGGLLIGQSVYAWEHDGQRYRASSRIETIGVAALFVPAQITQESSGLITDYGLQPETFRTVQKKRTDVALVDRKRLVAINGEREFALADAAERVQDMLSMYFQLSLLLAAAEMPPAEITLPIVTGRKLDTYRFELVAQETLTRDFHDYSTRHLRARNRDDVIDLWFTPELPLPLRLRIADRKGDVYEQWLDIPEKGFP